MPEQNTLPQQKNQAHDTVYHLLASTKAYLPI
jgi:hypothetical protein